MELFLKQHKSIIPRTSQACHECRKRKSKCIGNPCTYCVGKKINCIFPNAKKRGPKIKQIQDSSEVVGPLMPDFAINGIQFMHDIQMTLNTCYQQTSLVDFYFQFLGTFIPMEFKTTLMSPVKSQTTKAQLCIMFAHIVRVFNNTALHQQFIEEAQKNMNLFTECDTIDSAVALLMMCMLLGFKDKKTAFYANMSHNITKMLYSKSSPEIFKLLMVSRALAIEHSFPMFDKLGTLDECIPTTPDGLTPHEWIMVCVTRVDVYLLQYFELDSGTKALLEYINTPLPQDKQRIMIHSVQVLEDSYANSDDSWVINGRFTSSFSRFMMAWKNGNTSEALSYVFKIVEDLKVYSNYIALWKINYTTTLVAIPFFLKITGQFELSQQVMGLLSESVSRLKTYQEFLEMSAELLLLPTHESNNTEAGGTNATTTTSTIFEQNNNDNNININNINNINMNNINNINNINILEQFDFSPVESLFDHDPTTL